jgi:hypothetical protein
VLEASATPGPDAANGRLHAEVEIAHDLEALAIWPELPDGAESLEVSARHTTDKVDVLLFARRIPAGWPTSYVLAKPIAVPAGSRLFGHGLCIGRHEAARPSDDQW